MTKAPILHLQNTAGWVGNTPVILATLEAEIWRPAWLGGWEGNSHPF
jgi:hypothetical protein